MSFIGSCILDTSQLIPVTSMNSGIEANIDFYQHIVGLRDKNFTGTNNKGPATNSESSGGYVNVQRKIYKYSPGIFKAKISGPMSADATTLNIGTIIEHAIKGTEINQLDFTYFGSPGGGVTKEGHQVKLAVIENLTLSVAAGDVASFDLSIVAKKNEGSPTAYQTSTCSKLLTWDQCKITSALVGGSDLVQNFSISIKNTIIPIYVSGPESSYSATDFYYGPTALRLGTQEVTGAIGTYGFNLWNTTADTLKFELGPNTHQLHILYQPTASSASGSNEPYVSSTPFTGQADGPIWVSA